MIFSQVSTYWPNLQSSGAKARAAPVYVLRVRLVALMQLVDHQEGVATLPAHETAEHPVPGSTLEHVRLAI